MVAANNVSRGMATGTAIASAIIAAIIAALVGQVMSAPADRRLIEGAVKANTAALIGLNEELNGIAKKQDNVRERLTVVEAAAVRAGEDRYRGVQAELQVEHFNFRLDDIARRVGILEGVCYIGDPK